jgi:hypothetical protein
LKKKGKGKKKEGKTCREWKKKTKKIKNEKKIIIEKEKKIRLLVDSIWVSL